MTPPQSPVAEEDSDEMPDSEPDLPAPPPVPVIVVSEQDIVERQARVRAHRRRQRRDFSVHRALRAVRRIERGALTRMRSMTSHRSRRLYREDAPELSPGLWLESGG